MIIDPQAVRAFAQRHGMIKVKTARLKFRSEHYGTKCRLKKESLQTLAWFTRGIPITTEEVATAFGITKKTAQKRLALLADRGLIRKTQRGTTGGSNPKDAQPAVWVLEGEQ